MIQFNALLSFYLFKIFSIPFHYMRTYVCKVFLVMTKQSSEFLNFSYFSLLIVFPAYRILLKHSYKNKLKFYRGHLNIMTRLSQERSYSYEKSCT